MESRHVMFSLVLGLALGLTIWPYRSAMSVREALPPTWDIVSEGFESGSLASWDKFGPDHLSLVVGGGYSGSTGLSVSVDQTESYIRQMDFGRAKEGYLSFWFNPNGTSIPDQGTTWLPGKSIRLAVVQGTAYGHTLVALWLHKPTAENYKIYLAWQGADGNHYDDVAGDIDLLNGWHNITVGYRVDGWIALWLDGVKVREIRGISHDEANGEIIEIGKINTNTSITPSGQLRFDDVEFQVPRVSDLWVNAASGNDGYDGLTPATAFRSIQKAADFAGPGTIVHILPGIYRETVWPALSGIKEEPVVYRAENGPGTAIIRGSERADALAWTQLVTNSIGLPANVDPGSLYYADLSAWALSGPPRFVVQLGSGETVTRLLEAREPDWLVSTDWKYHEFWWAADGGSTVAACDPASDQNPNCDSSSRSVTQLTDRNSDSAPAGIAPGNLTTLGDLTGATLTAIDTVEGHYVFRRTIVAHDVGAGTITVDRPCDFDGDPGLGWGSKYYVENHPALLDTPGEWWYDTNRSRLYLWPPAAGNPGALNIEISRRDAGVNLENRSYITLDGLAIEFLNGNAVDQQNNDRDKSYGNTVRHARLRYADRGIYLAHGVSASEPAANVTRGWTLEDSEIGFMDTNALELNGWWDDSTSPTDFIRSPIADTAIRRNELHHLGFRSHLDSGDGAVLTYADHLLFQGNQVHDVAHNGVLFSKSVIQSTKTYDFTPEEIKTGEIFIGDNVFERACQLSTDCGALKIWGRPPDAHVFRDLLISGNVFRDTFGWAYVAERRKYWWSGGPSSEVQGMGGFGLSVDMASGVHVYRNIAYNNAYAGFAVGATYRDGYMLLYNNILANSLQGLRLGASRLNLLTHPSVDTQVVDNIIVNNEGYGIVVGAVDPLFYQDATLDHNLYFNNGWRSQANGGVYQPGAMTVYRGGTGPDESYQTLAAIQANTTWEDHGVQGNPTFWSYNPADHDLHDGSWPDFHLTSASTNALDRGTTTLPDSLTALLKAFAVTDFRRGWAYDIGRYEAGFALLASPTIQFVSPGGVARDALRLDPPDLPYAVTMSVTSPSPLMNINLSSAILAADNVVTLTIADGHVGPIIVPALAYTVPITATGGGFAGTTNIRLFVGGLRVYLPIIIKDAQG